MEEWSNSACLGYVILGLKRQGYSTEETEEIVAAVRSQFDSKSVEEAKEVYNKSPY
jgi:acyl-[acyl carrier protein]--UDP-N-acetylglucosamine O-acyltransferase